MKVIFGLGNPGPRYEGTRHNAGFLVVDELARRHAGAFRKVGRGAAARLEARVDMPAGATTALAEPLRAESARSALLPARDETASVLLVKPQGFMNLSGAAVQAVMARHRTALTDILVAHDDVDLPLGRLRFKQGGGAGGQRGVKDIADRVGTGFLRLKLGVSRPPEGWGTDGWVLSRFQAGERDLLAEVVSAAADAVEGLVADGLEATMNRVNGIDLGGVG